ncbi:hypothetical protein [Methylobacterium nonmethylotrophicum]|uniref:Uncharacterized protein n=1 Tax=Methylobacterium nonmethylotrophicum TaxID=1141884 RepID=A0A4Z0NDK1_9HYPH|nr:hypothetical protein [Methylobacterium nonmethylotrophicum]TGD91905.1 hypothetical protein EU555_35460 [Methylobacterium nonmethylotrophicum]
MPRYIIIDRNSGYIWGDSADFGAGRHRSLDPILACRLLDESMREPRREYEEVSHDDDRATYDVYEDTGTGEAIPVILEGRDKETINTVISSCKRVATIMSRAAK